LLTDAKVEDVTVGQLDSRGGNAAGKASYVCAERILPGWIVPNRVVCTVGRRWCSVTEVAFIVVFLSWWPRRMAAV
jgi:hypothetical protein